MLLDKLEALLLIYLNNHYTVYKQSEVFTQKQIIVRRP